MAAERVEDCCLLFVVVIQVKGVVIQVKGVVTALPA